MEDYQYHNSNGNSVDNSICYLVNLQLLDSLFKIILQLAIKLIGNLKMHFLKK